LAAAERDQLAMAAMAAIQYLTQSHQLAAVVVEFLMELRKMVVQVVVVLAILLAVQELLAAITAAQAHKPQAVFQQVAVAVAQAQLEHQQSRFHQQAALVVMDQHPHIQVHQ
jgi:hypothetical protein